MTTKRVRVILSSIIVSETYEMTEKINWDKMER